MEFYHNISDATIQNDFAEISKNLARYKSGNNCIRPSKYLYRKLKHYEQWHKKF